MVRVSGKIRRLLVDAGLITESDWNIARDKGGNVLDRLLAAGTVPETTLLEILARASGVARVDIAHASPDPSALSALPQETCLEHSILPISKNGDLLTVAVSDPFDVLLIDDLKRRTRCQIRQVLSSPPRCCTRPSRPFSIW